MYPSLFVLLCSDLPAVFRDAADIPFTVPKLTVADLFHILRHCRVFLYILFFTQIGGSLKETLDGPVVQEGYHGALTTAQIQAVIPVRTEAFAHTVLSHLSGGEV